LAEELVEPENSAGFGTVIDACALIGPERGIAALITF